MPITSTAPAKNPFVTIAGNPVSPGTSPLAPAPYADVLKKTLGTDLIEAHSRDTKQLVAPELTVSANSFIAAAQTAYARHYPLVLSPDIIWLLIAQGFAIHVRENAEALRHRFVAHEGKIELVAYLDGYIAGFAGNDWESVIGQFSQQIREHIGYVAHDMIVPNFSTTGLVEKAAFEITLMDAMQSYFIYVAEIVCGIPTFYLEGTPEDWKLLRFHAANLQQYDLDWWMHHLLPVLDEFVAASEGRANPEFWQNFYREKKFDYGGLTTVDGYLLAFFPYIPVEQEDVSKADIDAAYAKDYDKRETAQKELAGIIDMNAYGKRLEEIRRNLGRGLPLPTDVFVPALMSAVPLQVHEARGLEPNAFPAGLSRAPVKLRALTSESWLDFVAGFVGVAQDESTLALRPEIGWAVCRQQ